MGPLIRFVIVALLILTVISVIRGLLRGAAPTSVSRGSPRSGKLVKDPICGTYVTTGALSLRQRDQIFYFCSEECRGRFLKPDESTSQ